MSRRVLVGSLAAAVAFLAAAAGAGAAGGGAVRMVTVEPPGLGVSIAVPSSWGGACDTGTGSLYSIGAPAHAVKLDVFSSRATVPLASLRTALVTELHRRLGPRAVLAANTKLASGRPAVRLTFHYRGLWPCGSAGVGEIRHALYLVVHAGTLYTFDFAGIDPWAAGNAAIFEHSARSIRFVQVA